MNWSTRIGTSTFQLEVYFKYYLTDLLNQIRTSIEFSLLRVPCYCYQAFVKAWKLACNTSNSVFLIPNGRRYQVNATRFRGPCSHNFIVQVVSYTIFTFLSKTRRLCLGISLQIISNPCVRHWSCLMSYSFRCWVQIEGTIVAPDEPKNWDPKNPRSWLDFFNLTGVLFQGGGVIDGSGSKWWAASCKRNKSNVMFFFSRLLMYVKSISKSYLFLLWISSFYPFFCS